MLPDGYKLGMLTGLTFTYDSLVTALANGRNKRLGTNDMLVALPLEDVNTQVKIALVYNCEVIALFEYDNHVTMYGARDVASTIDKRSGLWGRLTRVCSDNDVELSNRFGVTTLEGSKTKDGLTLSYNFVNGICIHHQDYQNNTIYSRELYTE